MNTIIGIKKLRSHPKYLKIAEWGKLLTIVGSGQAVVQGLSLVTGILIVRLLPIQEYALYTLANTMLGTMTVLADSGISSGVMAEGGKVWKDKHELGKVLVTGLYLRKKFAIFSLLISTPVLVWLLLKHGASWISAILIFLAIIPAFFAALSDSLLEVAPKLQQDIMPLQKNQIGAGIGRLLLQSAGLFLLPFTWIALLGNGIPRMYANIKLKKISSGYADYNQPPDTAIQKDILKVVKRFLPGAIYYCISGQINIWIISIFGSSNALAEVGALSRLAMIINVFTILINTLFVPRFSRLPSDKKALFKLLMIIQAALFLISLFFISAAWLFPSEILWVLGNNYKGLDYQLLLSVASACASFLAGITFWLYVSRGWVIKPVIYITINIAIIVIFAFMLNLSTLNGVLLLNLFTGLAQFIMNLCFISYKIKTVKAA